MLCTSPLWASFIDLTHSAFQFVTKPKHRSVLLFWHRCDVEIRSRYWPGRSSVNLIQVVICEDWSVVSSFAGDSAVSRIRRTLREPKCSHFLWRHEIENDVVSNSASVWFVFWFVFVRKACPQTPPPPPATTPPPHPPTIRVTSFTVNLYIISVKKIF